MKSFPKLFGAFKGGHEMSFDYEKFEKDLLLAVDEYAKSQLYNKDDMYIMSIEYFPDFTTFIAIRANTYSYLEEQVEEEDEDYTYYKYCEEEWDLYESLEEISSVLQDEYNKMEEKYDDDEFDELQTEHATKIIDVCKNVMKKFKETDTYKEFKKLYLNVYVREYFNEEETIQIFGELNGKDSIEEYSDWV